MTIFKRPGSPNFYFGFTAGGIRRAGSTKTANRREAAKVEAEERKKAKGPVSGGKLPEQMSLAAAFEKLFASRWSRTRDALRVKARGERIVALLGEDTPLSSIDASAISRMLSSLREKGLKDSSCNRYTSTISTLLITARREWGVLDKAVYVKLFKESRGRDRTFTLAEEEKILTLLRTYVPPRQSRTLLERRRGAGFNLHAEAADIFAVLLDTGMRLGEAVAIEARDVNLGTNMIHIWKNKSDRPRSVPMTERARGILLPRLTLALALGRPLVFQLTCADMEGVWRRRIRHLPEFEDGAVLHSARHTFSSRLASRGVPMLTLARLLGHASTRMVERYSHLQPADLASAVSLLNPTANLLNPKVEVNPLEVANSGGSVVNAQGNDSAELSKSPNIPGVQEPERENMS